MGSYLYTGLSSTINYVGAYSRDSSGSPNQGLRCTLDVTDLSLPLTTNAVVGVWIAEELTNSWWQQISFFASNGAITGFAQLWDLTSNTILPNGGFGWSVEPGTHQFSMQLISGTTWGYYMDGVLEGSYNMEASESMGTGASQPLEALVEQQLLNGQAAYSVPDISFPIALEAYVNGEWVPVQVGNAWSQGPYGVQGTIQNSSLAPNSIVVGTSIAQIAQGTELWSGVTTDGPTPTTLALTVQKVG